MDPYLCILFGILVILVMLSGFFSASETALTAFRSINLQSVEQLHKGKEAELLKRWLTNPNEILTGMLLGNNLVNNLTSSIATVITLRILAGKDGSSVAVATILTTVIILIFGEITPKILAKNNSTEVAIRVIKIVTLFVTVTKPLIKIFLGISRFLGRMLGVNVTNDKIFITSDDIISFVNVGEAEGVIEEDEKEMIHSIVFFGETTAKEVMTPRTSVLAFEADNTIDEIWEEMMKNGFSRIPIYDKTIDDIVGVLYVKDIMNAVKEGKTKDTLRTYARPPYFVPETKSVMDILKEFRELQVHIAMVLDEYGGIVGIVTIEDLIEEIVGEIRDEYDTEEEESIEKIDDTDFEIDGMLDIEEINEELGTDLPVSEEYESLGGLIVKELGRVANVDDIVTIGNVELKVLSLDKMRISKVLVKIKQDNASDSDVNL